MMEIIKLLGIGMILGISNVIPGVSGGTMAVVFNVYERLLSVITINVKKILSEWKFVLPLGLGVVFGIIIFSKVITYLFTSYPVPTNMFFCGLITGSIPLILRKIPGRRTQKLKPSIIISLLAAFALMTVMLLVSPEESSIIYTDMSFSLFIRLFVSAALAAVAMIIPGISGSFLMIVLGMYTTIIASVSNMNIPFLIPVALGVMFGLLFGARLVTFLMSRVPAQTYGAILGLVAGSLLLIFPWRGFVESYEEGLLIIISAVSAVSALIGFFLAYASSKNET